MVQALEGIRVLDFTRIYAGPICTRTLGDIGADVIKVENPVVSGRMMRRGPERLKGRDPLYIFANRNKRSIAVNLKQEEGRQIIYKLVPKCDVIVENFRPGVMKRLGLDYETASRINPGIVYCSMSGWGDTGPWATHPGQDMLAQAASGAMSLTGPSDGPPLPQGYSAGDHGEARVAAFCIVTALLARERLGFGQEIKLNLFSAMVDLQGELIFYHLNTERPARRSKVAGVGQWYNTAPYGVFQTKDRRWVVLVESIDVLSKVLGLPDYSKDERLATFAGRVDNSDWLHLEIQKKVVLWNRDKLLEKLWEADAWCAPVYDIDELLAEPQLAANDMIIEIEDPVAGKVRMTGFPSKFSKTPWQVRRPPPVLGQHNKEILSWLGYSADEIDQLEQQGVIGHSGS